MLYPTTQPVKPSIREALLAELREAKPRRPQDNLQFQQTSVLEGAAKRLGVSYEEDQQQAILTVWGDLFRTGLLAWGRNLSNPGPPYFHLTDRGRQALENFTRDPSNPAGYLPHLVSVATLEPVGLSYLTEALECYVAGLFKAAAVMVGAAAERIVLDLRNCTVQKLTSLQRPVPRDMKDRKIKTVSDALHGFFERQGPNLGPEGRESFQAYWSAFTQQIRATRNDAGHPTSVDPVTPDTVHASLLVFPEVARLANSLSLWVDNELE
jgi:hypothetical protein